MLDAADEGVLPEWLGAARTTVRHAFARFENGVETAREPKNMKALALLTTLLGWDPEFARATLRRRFGHRTEVLRADLEAFEGALDAQELPALPRLSGVPRELHVETGNEAMPGAAPH